MSERVAVTITDGVADVRLVRSDKHNALDLAMFEGLRDAALEVRDDPTVRAVALSGEGKSFCSGLDVMSFVGEGGIDMEPLVGRPNGETSNLAQAVATLWREVPVPVFAALHGNCFGGGMQIALGADVRIAAPDARLSIMEIKWGLVPDMGLGVTLPPLVRQDVAKELTWTGRIVSGAEAVELGLATRTDEDPRAGALAAATAVAERSPHAIRAGKALLEDAYAGGIPAVDVLRLETKLQVALIGSPNQLAAAGEGLGGPPAQYADPEPTR